MPRNDERRSHVVVLRAIAIQREVAPCRDQAGAKGVETMFNLIRESRPPAAKWKAAETAYNAYVATYTYIVLCVCSVPVGVYCGGPHGRFRQHFHHPRQTWHDFCLDTGGALARPPCTQAVIMATFAWMVQIVVKFSMRASAVHAN
jgi:hypothetical protein